MKENVLDVLMFLFDNYLSIEDGIPPDEDLLTNELEEAGFHTKEIHKAFDWLGGLAQIKNTKPAILPGSKNAIRVYLPQEQRKLDTASRGFMHQLEKMDLVDTNKRELIIERAMAIDTQQLSLKQFKRIVGLVMLNSTPPEERLGWIEDLLYEEGEGTLN